MIVSEAINRARTIAKAILAGDLSAYEGGTKIWKNIVDHLEPPIPDALWVFKSNASAIEDCYTDTELWGSDHRELIECCEQEIIEAALQLVRSSDKTVRTAIDVGLVVSDLERSLGFYCDLIGLPVVATLTTSLIGRGRMVQLNHGSSRIKLVELDENPAESSPIGISKALGYRYITLLVADLEEVMGRLDKNKTPIVVPMTQHPSGTRITMVEDPDGNIVEFVQEARL